MKRKIPVNVAAGYKYNRAKSQTFAQRILTNNG